jgi:hypothetical protein
VTRPLEKDVMSVSAPRSSGAPMKLAIGVPLAALTKKSDRTAKMIHGP